MLVRGEVSTNRAETFGSLQAVGETCAHKALGAKTKFHEEPELVSKAHTNTVYVKGWNHVANIIIRCALIIFFY